MDGPPQLFRIRPSRTRLAVGAAAHLLALSACLAGIPSGLGLPLALLLALGLGREVLGYARSGVLLLGAGRDGWWIEERGVRSALQILGASRVWPSVVLLEFRTEDGVRRLLIAPDSLPLADLRRLRVALRLAGRGSGREDGIDGLR